jgi:hypothetical protein
MTGIQKYDSKFIRDIFAASAAAAFICMYPAYMYASANQLIALGAGYLVSLINILAGFWLYELAYNRNTKSFMVLVFGGMLVRMFFVAVCLLILLYVTRLDTVVLTSSVFFFYFLFMSIEIYHLSKKSSSKSLKLT